MQNSKSNLGGVCEAVSVKEVYDWIKSFINMNYTSVGGWGAIFFVDS